MGENYKRDLTVKLHQYLKEIESKLDKSGNSNVPILIFTNFGHIECHLAKPENVDNDPVATIFTGAVELANITDLPALHLKDAKITPYGEKQPAHIVKDMVLFTDQIIGLSFR
ncbi:hypothetical protein QNH46_07925 [Paenibacillus woosongensis]|uniref:Uncharacterized protein n=1 Tax=Paenibacillus woosongensis TaxID=307580 RepID=A0AA95IA27_9BACL|nr:hypothetical protein [Paenibacillus woosongensis]WHX50563.1 hypothetical protein QNH46_07925 [Paenibacillus woosongensis]